MSPARVLLLLAVGVPLGPADGRAERPQVLYQLHCQGCHLADGSGSPGAVPSLIGVARFATLTDGRAYLIGVPGSAQAPLSDDELASVLNWMMRQFGPVAVAERVAPFDAGEVGRHRTPPLRDVERVRAGLLEEIDGRGD